MSLGSYVLKLSFSCVLFRVSFEHAKIKNKDQRVWVCLEHARCKNAAEVRRQWPGLFINIPAPTKRTITKTYQKFLREATCYDLNKGCSGCPRAVRTPENIKLVQESLTQHGNRSS